MTSPPTQPQPHSQPTHAERLKRQRRRTALVAMAWFVMILTSLPSAEASFFSGTEPSIHEDIVTLNDSAIEVVNFLQPTDYSVQTIPNITDPDKNGLKGILYNRGLSCTLKTVESLAAPTLPPNFKRIALIMQGNCTLEQKLLNAQLDLADGAIVYNNMPSGDSDLGLSIMSISFGAIGIPAYYVTLDVGEDLIQKMVQFDNTTTRQFVRVTMNPSQSAAGAWEFTLIVVVVLLAISFVTSVAMHLHLWRLRHRHRLLLEQGLIPNGPIYTMQAVPKLTIEPEVLDTFPVRVVGAPPSSVSVVDRSSAANLAGALKRSNSNKSVRSVKAVENAEAVAKGRRSKIEDPGTTFGDEDDEGTCVICLDEFEEGDKVRKLVCRHEYHCECIDPWLTQKTASCPLCKRDCSRPLDAEGREVDGYDKSQDSSVAVDPPEPAVPRSGRWNWARMVGRPQRAGVQAWSGAV